jgi:hypothetical protein
VHSSIHAQNAILNEFLGQGLDTSINTKSNNMLSKMLRLSREELLQRSSVSPSLFQSDSNHDADRLQISVVDIAKGSMCPVSVVSDHLVRVVNHLWRAIVFGCGEANPRWANPGAFLPLRVQAFATLLQVLGSTSVFFSKRGLAQLDGSGKWNLILLSRILAVAFDEGELFGISAEESLDDRFLSLFRERAKSGISKDKRRKHVRSRFEFLNDSSTDSDETVDAPSSADFVGINRAFRGLDSQNFPAAAFTASSSSVIASGGSDDGESGSSTVPGKEWIKVDSVTDFRSALKVGLGEMNDNTSIFDGSRTGSIAAMSLVKAFSGPQGVNRRWMTAPAPGLATIREDGDDGGDESTNAITELPSTTRIIKGPLDSVDTELFVKPANSPVKQMRVPKVTKKSSDQDQPDASDVDKPRYSSPSAFSIAPDSKAPSDMNANEM